MTRITEKPKNSKPSQKTALKMPRERAATKLKYGQAKRPKHREAFLLELSRNGFARFSWTGLTLLYAEALVELLKEAASMPLDLTDGGAGRARLYGRYHLLPWLPGKSKLRPEPGRFHNFNGQWGLEYTQPAVLNSAAKGKRRVFKALSAEVYKNQLLIDLILSLWAQLPLDEDLRQGAFQVGIHLLKLAPSETSAAVASPPLVHRDGEPFTAALLLSRMNVTGGENVITFPEWHNHPIEQVPAAGVLARFTLEKPLTGYIVDDLKVAHFVGPVSRTDVSQPSERVVLLIDFTPARPAIVLDGIDMTSKE